MTKAKKAPAKMKPVAREYTIKLGKYLYKKSFKKRARVAVKAVKDFAFKQMGTREVRVDPGLNKHLWSRGCRAVPRRVRVRLERRRDEDEDGDGWYTLATHVPVDTFHGLTTQKIEG